MEWVKKQLKLAKVDNYMILFKKLIDGQQGPHQISLDEELRSIFSNLQVLNYPKQQVLAVGATEGMEWVHAADVEVASVQPIFSRSALHSPLQGLSSLHQQVLLPSRPHDLCKQELSTYHLIKLKCIIARRCLQILNVIMQEL